MRRIASLGIGVAATVGLLGIGLAPTASAVAPAESASPQTVQACVVALSWGTSGSSRTVTVRNNCSGKRCYRVDVPYRADPLLSVASYATETDNYASTFYQQGRGIYDDSCLG